MAEQTEHWQIGDLHEDHIGWDTHRRDDEWVPTFANARHVYVGDELDYAVRADHTPGHVAIAIDTSGDPLVISGDLLHHQVQLANPLIAEIADWDVELARELITCGRDRSPDCPTRPC